MRHLTAVWNHRIARAILLTCVFATLMVLNRNYWLEARDARAESVVVATSEVLYVPDVRTTRIIGLGYDQAMADLMWVRTLGYFGKHFSGDKDYRWLEHFIEQIMQLDPKFRKVYHWAGTNVLYGRAFTNQNVRISNRFYKKAIERFPDDFEAAYRLGLNYYVEMRADDPVEKRKFREIGLSYLEMAANRPDAPDRIRSLVASISSKLGKQQVALQYLIDLYVKTTDEKTKESIKSRIDELRGAQDKSTVLAAAQAFETKREALTPYLPPGLYALMGEPESIDQRDVDWRTLLPDVKVATDDPRQNEESP